MKAKEVLKLLNISRLTLCKYLKRGFIKANLLPTGGYDYNKESINSFLNKNYERKTVIYARVSTLKQEQDLNNQVDLVEESYTSKIDHLANESMENHEVYLGKRTKRGLFKSSTGLKLNADINGALGMLRKAKVACESFFQEIVASRGSVLRPVKLSC
jgi:predicted site-specific integrase-resolvase